MRRPVLLVPLLFAAGALGCQGKLQEIVPKDLSAHVADAGGAVDLGSLHFSTDIQKSLNGLTCASATSCHQSPGGVAPLFVAMATTDADLMANFASFRAECDPASPAMSAILLDPLDAPGTTHNGGMLFQSTSDPSYELWLAWITDGEQY